METQQLQYQISRPGLPLAVYREVAAHLRQVEGVEVNLIPQTSQEFDYNQSQVAGLCIQHTDASDRISRERVNQILAYYQLQQIEQGEMGR
ncbi:MAG TPA: hypothetical protein DDZ80_04990 [Cyanobacteria bacterium UBA8803]|nr:hypothetical protein [Cyanobacteria bacterium UBA9273]HBL57906.1 hypothetical protein [Cyanobacteria bacterium UBA8803]